MLFVTSNARLTIKRTGNVLAAMGQIRIAQGKMDEAFQFHDRSVALLKVTRDEYHPMTADAYYRLARHYIRLSRFVKAA